MQYDLGKWATNARKHAKLTQEKLAEAIGFSGKGSISAIEKGTNKPTFETMLKIAEICNYPLPYQNQVINNNAEHIQVGGNNFGTVSYIHSSTNDNNIPLFDIDQITRKDLIKNFLITIKNNDLSVIGILKDDVLIVNPNLKPKHGNIVLVNSDNDHNLIAQLSIDLKNQFSLKYNQNEPEIMPENACIIGVITSLKRTYA